MPAVFYFALSGMESLVLDPYNQPALEIANKGFRVFSLTLPGHHGSHPHPEAIKTWLANIENGSDFVKEFIDTCSQALKYLIASGYIDKGRIATAGLSRGAFIAAHMAARNPDVKILLGFAPLTRLETLPEFHSTAYHPLQQQLSLHAVIDQLAGKTVRFYIGNRDVRVDTAECFSFIQALTEVSHAHHHRSPPIELIIYPSVGHKGHGTPPHIFLAGIQWLSSIFAPSV